MPVEVLEDRQPVASLEVEVGLVPLLQIRQTDRLLQALAEELQQRVQEEPGVARTYQVEEEQLGVVRTCPLLAVVVAAAVPSSPLVVAAVVVERYS